MKQLFTIDLNDYTQDMTLRERYCVRAYIVKQGRIAVQRSRDGECKLLGGGIESDEELIPALTREVREESGLLLKPDTMEEIGQVTQKYRDLFDPSSIYCCHTLFYRCDVEDETVEPQLTASEQRKGFTLQWVTPEELILYNEAFMELQWIYRDTKFVSMIEGITINER